MRLLLALLVLLQTPQPPTPGSVRMGRAPGGSVLGTHTVQAPGWVTFGHASLPGAVPRGSGIQCAGLETQVDVLTRYPDGAAWHTAVTCKPTTTGNLATVTAPAKTGTFEPGVIPRASVSMNISSGEVTGTYVATKPSGMGTDCFYSGPLMKECRHAVIPQNAAGVAHPTIRVIFDTRIYNDPSWPAWVSTEVLNAKDTPTGTGFASVHTVTINGTKVAGPGTKQDWGSVDIGHFSGWRRTWNVARLEIDRGMTQGVIAQDRQPFIDSKLIHRYQSIAPNERFGSLDGPAFYPGAQCGTLDNWGETGIFPYLGYTTSWNVQYLVHKEPGTRDFIIRQSECSLRWEGFHTKSDGVDPINLDEFPNYFSHKHNNATPAMPGTTGPFHWGSTQMYQENAHKRDYHYIPWLLFVDRFHYDALRQYALYTITQINPSDPGAPHLSRTYEGVPGGQIWNDQLRGMGRGFQQIVQAWAATRDDERSPLDKEWWRLRVHKNLRAADAIITGNLNFIDSAGNKNVLGYVWVGYGGTCWKAGFVPPGRLACPASFQPNSWHNSSHWMQSYIVFAVHRAIEVGAAAGAGFGTDGQKARDATLNWGLRGFRDKAWTGGRPYAMCYQVMGGAHINSAGQFRWYQSLTDAWNDMVGVPPNAENLAGCPPMASSGYGPEGRALARLAEDLGHPDGKEIREWIDTYSNAGATVAQMLRSPTWAGFTWDGIR